MNPKIFEEINDSDYLSILESDAIITTNDMNLRSKIASINRSLKQLMEKKLRIEFEIRRQKKSLTRKREELKKASKRSKVKISATLESLDQPEATTQAISKLKRIDDLLLQESDRLLEMD